MSVLDEQLQEIIAQHGLWLSSDGKEGRRANLEGADMRQADLSGADLSRAIMKEARLERAELSGAVLRETDLTGAKLDYSQMRKTDLTRARLPRANLSRAVLEKATLSGADLSSSIANYADFSDANLDGALLARSEFRQASFRKASLREAMLMNAILEGADFTQACVDDAVFERAMLDKANLHFGSRKGADFDLVRLRDALIRTENLDLLKASFSDERTYRSPERIDEEQLTTQKRRIASSRAGLLTMLGLVQRAGMGIFYVGLAVFLLMLAADAYVALTPSALNMAVGFSYAGSLTLAAFSAFLATCAAFLRLHLLQAAAAEDVLSKMKDAEISTAQLRPVDASLLKEEDSLLFSADRADRRTGGA